MRRKILIAALSVGAVACAQQGKLAIRPLATSLAQGDRPVSFRVAEAAGQFRLGNVALALESYRKALREDSQSIDALVGRAACYDVFGRFDLSRRDYEAALALAPADTRLLGLFAASLVRQGHTEEAAAVQREIASRISPASPGQSVTVALPVARPAPAETIAPATVELSPQTGLRLERLSLGEVALVTTALTPIGAPQKTRVADSLSSLIRSAAVQPSSLRPFAPTQTALRPILILNAARSEGLAGRTRHYLAGRGLGPSLIGDAPRVIARSMIIAPRSERARAQRLARIFAITSLTKPGTRLTLVLGRDLVRAALPRG
jgi:tetratricopeptide (TPR) repeat protein